MGVDINIQLEFWLPEENRWSPLEYDGRIPRDATCFNRDHACWGFLAGVMGHGPGWFADRGLPEGRDPRDLPYLGEYGFTYATIQELLDAPWDLGATNWDDASDKEMPTGQSLDGCGFHAWLYTNEMSHKCIVYGYDCIRVLMGFG